jgi:hypothetical protein
MSVRRCQRALYSFVLLLAWFSLFAAGQTTPGSASKSADQKSAANQPSAGDQSPLEKKISPAEAEQLFRDVDQILKFSSDDTSLPIKSEVKRRLVDRDEVVAFLKRSMAEDKDTQRLERSEAVLKKFGLLPADFDLQTYLVNLLREQVAAYYDPKTKTVNLLDWVELDQQRPVLAHELTHALQDQSFGVEKFLKASDTDLDDKPQPTWEDFLNDEASDTRQAVVEGQAMVVLVDYILAPTGRSLLNSQEMVDALKAGMLVGTPDQVQFHNAPVYLKEALTFPYRYGLDFTADLLRSGGKERAYQQPFKDPPQISRQIMEPQTYLTGEKLTPMPIPNFNSDFKDYDRFDLGAVGEFDTAVLMDQYAGLETSRALYPAWRGGYYYAARSKKDPTAPLALLYVSRWADASHAMQFADLYSKALGQRYHHVRAEDSAVVPGSAAESNPQPKLWLSDEGEIAIEVRSDSVFITESMDAETRVRVEKDLWPAAAPAK